MRPTGRAKRNEDGQLAPRFRSRVPTIDVERQIQNIPIDAEQPVVAEPQQTQPLNILKKFKIETIVRATVFCFRVLTWIVWILFMLGKVSYWIASLAFLKTLFVWRNTAKVTITALCWLTARDCSFQSIINTLFLVD